METQTMSKYKGIDEREIKCCDNAQDTIEAGISFDTIYKFGGTTNVLRFHFLDYVNLGGGKKMLDQKTKSMHLNKENTKQLIKQLRELRF